MDVWECDLLDVQAYAKYNVNYSCILSVIDVFSKYIHLIPVWTKNGPSVASTFHFIFHDRLRPIWVRHEKGKEFLNKHFQDILQDEVIQFEVCMNSDLKCAVVERVQRAIRDRIYRHFAYTNTYRYIWMYYRNLSRPTMKRFTRRQAWRLRESPTRTCWRYGREWMRPGRSSFTSLKQRHFGWESSAH